MKSICFSLLLLLSAGCLAQVESVNVNLKGLEEFTSSRNKKHRMATNCQDTIRYVNSKTTGLRALSVNNASSAQRVAQYFNASQPVRINGFSFFGWSSSLPIVPVTAEIYAVGSDSLPAGLPLVSQTIQVDTTFGNGSLSVVKRNVVFSNPVTVTQPFLVILSNPSADNIAVVSSDYTSNDGAQEWLASLDLFGTWTRAQDVLIGGNPFDCDFLFDLNVSYDLQSNFTSTAGLCIDNTPINFTNTSSGNYSDRMYNLLYANSTTEDRAHTWNFDDGFATASGALVTHQYNPIGAQTYNVSLNDTLFGWTTTCTSDTIIPIGVDSLTPSFSTTIAGGVVDFTDESLFGTAITSWDWDFGDGASSNTQDPSHTYGSTGTYEVCLTATNSCFSEEFCDSVSVTVIGVGLSDWKASRVIVYPNPASDLLQVKMDQKWSSIELLDIAGKLILVQNEQSPINLSNVAPGWYVLRVSTYQGEKIVVQFEVSR